MTELDVNTTEGSKTSDANLIRAAEYIRMSMERQEYSDENQSAAIRRYAQQHGMTVVKTYADRGKSGLNIEGRAGLRQLIEDVESGNAAFKIILVYDVSRWGRFQDADESAFYEYKCRQNGISIHYCAEQFLNDGSPVATIVKGIKRAMAGEYSRELSAKVWAGQSNLSQRGYRQGGEAGYGLRRMRIDENRKPLGILERYQRKSLQTDRVILVPGPPDEVETVRWIFRQFVESKWTFRQIARALNRRGLSNHCGARWSGQAICRLLTNEKYIGNNVYNRKSNKLGKQVIRNEPDMWIRSDGAFEGIVNEELFESAQQAIQERDRVHSDEEMLTSLKRLWEQHGKLSAGIIEAAENVKGVKAYKDRFGGLIEAYELLGLEPVRDWSYRATVSRLRRFRNVIVDDISDVIQNCGGTVEIRPYNKYLTVNGEFTAAIVVARCQTTKFGTLLWGAQTSIKSPPDIVLILRMNKDNDSVRDYYIIPQHELIDGRIRLREENDFRLDAYRFSGPRIFIAMTQRVQIKEMMQ